MSEQPPGGSPTFEEPDFSKFGGAADAAAEVAPASDEDDDMDENALEPGAEDWDAAEAEAEAEGNLDEGGAALAVLRHVATAIVDEKDAVEVETREHRGGVRLSLHVAQGDMGRIIGRRGRTAQALRTLVRAAAASDGREASVDIVD